MDPSQKVWQARVNLLENVLRDLRDRIGLIGPDEPRNEDGTPDWHTEIAAIESALNS